MSNLDPVGALLNYKNHRDKVYGKSESLPFFLHEDGRLLTSKEMNSTLKVLLSLFPTLSQSERDMWSGHSFHRGLLTLLEKLGFTESEIKAWGRWMSSAYLNYLKDLKARRNVQARMTSTFALILEDFTKN